MTPSARLSAAIEVVDDIVQRRRPAPDALKDWGLAHRFAGSGDRAAIASLVYDALRRKASAQWLMGGDGGRAIVLGMLARQRGLAPDAIEALCSGERHAPARLDEAERLALARGLERAPGHVAADVPEWIWPAFETCFGPDALAEAEALAARAPIDIRTNDLKTTRARLERELAHLDPVPTPHSPDGLRFLPRDDGRGPSLHTEKAFLDGLFEVQDEGSQLVARWAGAEPGQTVIDLCAGAGGKTLALAALMQNRGQILATESDARRLAPLYERLKRSGARNVQVLSPRGRDHDPLEGHAASANLVLVDAPCTGSGTWRRNPDAKWRLRPGSLEVRIREQEVVLARAARLVRPGGRLAYITCSVLPQENDARIAALLAAEPGFRLVEPAGGGELMRRWRTAGGGVQLTPLRAGVDGFYLAMLERAR